MRRAKKRVTRDIWTTKDGQSLKIREMSTSHLMNTIAFIERKTEEFRHMVPYPVFQGEMAQFYAEQQFDSLMEEPVESLCADAVPQYPRLLAELHRRITDKLSLLSSRQQSEELR